MDQHKQTSWHPKSSLTSELHTGLQAAWILCLSTLPPDSRPWFPNEMQNLLLSEKRTLDHRVLFLHSPGKTLLTLSLVQKWLGSPFPEDVWAWWLLSTDSSYSPLLVKFSQVFESALLDSILKLAVIPVACAPFPTQFFLPVKFAFNMLWYSTLWTATPLCNDLLWLILFVDGVNDCLLDHCQVSSLPIIVLYCVLFGIIVEILDCWLSWAVSSNHQNKKNKTFFLNVLLYM